MNGGLNNNVRVKSIDLTNYITSGTKVFSGEESGSKARQDFNLRDMDINPGIEVKVMVPKDTWGIHPSFFRGMFEDSIRTLKENFRNRYIFVTTQDNKLPQELEQDVENDVDIILNESH